MRRRATVIATVMALGCLATTGVASAGVLSPGGSAPGGFGSGGFGPGAPSQAGPCSGGYVSLTFDDGPTASTPLLLALLRLNRATATFFDVGAQMQQYPNLVKDEARLGQVANHSYDHPYLDELDYDAVYNELLGTNQIAQQLTGSAPVLFRPPYDRIDSDVTAAQYSLGLLTALWNVDSDDYDGIGVAQIARNVWNAGAGDVILFHDGVRNTLLALPLILQHFQDKRICTGILVPSVVPHLAWPTASYGDVVFYAQVAAPGTRLPSVASLHLTPQQMSTGVGPDAAVTGD